MAKFLLLETNQISLRMFNNPIHLASNHSGFSNHQEDDSSFHNFYSLDTERLQRSLEPFRWIAWANLALVGVGAVLSLFSGMTTFVEVLATLVGVGGLFYLTGLLFLYPIYQRDKSLELELDFDTGFIHYKSATENLLFHRDQVQVCEWQEYLLFPHRIDQVTLYLEGERTLKISNLIIDPIYLINWLQSGYVPRQYWVGVAA